MKNGIPIVRRKQWQNNYPQFSGMKYLLQKTLRGTLNCYSRIFRGNKDYGMVWVLLNQRLELQILNSRHRGPDSSKTALKISLIAIWLMYKISLFCRLHSDNPHACQVSYVKVWALMEKRQTQEQNIGFQWLWELPTAKSYWAALLPFLRLAFLA